MSTTAPQGSTHPPYTVEQQRHDIKFREDGTQGGEYTVHIRHRNGVKTQFKVPEEHYNPDTVHTMAMHQVNAVKAVDQLPHSAPSAQAQGGAQ